MPRPDDTAARPETEFPFLCVDGFLADVVGASALASALELGLIDRLAADEGAAADALAGALDVEPRGLAVLIDLLRANRVLVVSAGAVSLSAPFRAALAYRDLLEARLDFAAATLPDYHQLFSTLIRRPDAFVQRARIFDMFRYDRCFEATADNVARTRRWVRLTTTLTKYEARACLAHHDFTRYRRMLDIGGNSGELALRLCRAYPALSASVLDLPVVCDIGEAHLAQQPEATRILFLRGDARRDPLPTGHDLICFKSFLHDWPPDEALRLIDKAAAALAPGGTLLIFERGPITVGNAVPSYAMIPNLLFLYYLRPPDAYATRMAASGLTAAEVRQIDLEMPFHLVTARKPR